MTQNHSNRVLFLLFPALTMSLGWALRGFIGGGPLGAMIPGAMVALALALLLKLPSGAAARAAAFGAVGVGFGGEMTYGQTVGFAGQAGSMGWGLLGLALKGGVWGLLGGAVVATGFLRGAFSSRRIVGAFTLMVAACWAGWRFVNHPKLIYFSNLADRPREEVWAGLLAAGIAVVLVMRNSVVTRFALLAAVGGFVGFGGGGLFISLHRILLTDWKWLPSWKLMEYTFGLFFGLALAAAAWSVREALAREADEDVTPPEWPQALGTTVFAVFASVLMAEKLGARFEYLIVGAMLMSTLLAVRWLAWHVALTMTFACFSWDLAENVCERMQLAPMMAGWIFVAVSSVWFWWTLDRRVRREPSPVRFGFLLLVWTSMSVASVKTVAQIITQPHFPYEYPLFLASMLGVLWMERRVSA
jgi:hypothetical protein